MTYKTFALSILFLAYLFIVNIYECIYLSGDLCRPLNCKKKELCLLEDAFTAVCVSKKDLHKNRYVVSI